MACPGHIKGFFVSLQQESGLAGLVGRGWVNGTELCGLCPVNILDGKEGCEERGVRSKGMENSLREVCSKGG